MLKLLKEHIKTMKFQNVYLFFGDEKYLIEHYEQTLIKNVLAGADEMMNRDKFEGEETGEDQIISAAETMPFLSGARLIHIKDSKLLTLSRKQESEALAKYMDNIPETSVLLFVESEVDKRSRLYKKITEKGCPVEFVNPSDGELITWIGNVAGKSGLKISRDNSSRLLRTVSRDMNVLVSEIGKLTGFAAGRAEITADDIAAVCNPSLETRIFDLVSAMAFGKTGEALQMFRNMINMKEAPLMILSMISRQFRLILQCKSCAENKMPVSAAAKEAGIRDFVVNECLRQGKRYTNERLKEALRECQKTDIMIKTGGIDDVTGITLIIIEYAN